MTRSLPFLGVFLGACTGQSQEGGGAANFPMPDHKASLEMYVMSECPYGVQVENAIAPVKEKLGNALDVQINYIGQKNGDQFQSLHGPTEVSGDIVQLCAAQQGTEKLIDFITCQNANPKQVAENWKDCGTQSGYDVGALETCMNGDQGKKLLSDSYDLSQSKNARSSPTIMLDGQPYRGGRKTNDFLRAICATYGDQSPPPCKDIPQPPEVNAVFLSDDRCKECDLHPLEDKLKTQLPGLKVKYLDVKADEGKAMYDSMIQADPNFKLLPAVLVTQADLDKDTDAAGMLKRYMTPVGSTGLSSLKVGAKFDPKAEICDNQLDDDGDAKVDCADDGCSSQLICRDSIPNKLDLFVMSHCPYGAKALVATNDMIKAFGDKVSLDVHYIGTNKDGQLSSMHGPTEVDDDIREVCAQEKYPKNFQALQFMACISKDVKNADWKACATESKMDPNVIQTCFDGEGKDLLAKSFASADDLNIGSSPTFLSNNKRTFNAIAVDALQKQFCQDNPTLTGCSATITQDAAAAAPVPAGACGGN